MSIAEKLQYLKQVKQDIKLALISKGAEIADSDSFKSYASYIDALKIGGGGADEPSNLLHNVLIRGNLKAYNGILSGFDKNSYAILDGRIADTYPREFVIAFKTGSDITTKQAIFTTNMEEQLRGWWLYLENAELFFGWSGKYNEVSVHSIYTVSPDTEYLLKISQSEVRERSIYISDNGGETWERIKYDMTSTSGNHWGGTQGAIALGMAGQSAGAEDTEPIGTFLGTFNLIPSYIKIGDEVTWEGVQPNPDIEPEEPTQPEEEPTIPTVPTVPDIDPEEPTPPSGPFAPEPLTMSASDYASLASYDESKLYILSDSGNELSNTTSLTEENYESVNKDASTLYALSNNDTTINNTVALTQEEYDALEVKDENTLYMIKEENTVKCSVTFKKHPDCAYDLTYVEIQLEDGIRRTCNLDEEVVLSDTNETVTFTITSVPGGGNIVQLYDSNKVYITGGYDRFNYTVTGNEVLYVNKEFAGIPV